VAPQRGETLDGSASAAGTRTVPARPGNSILTSRSITLNRTHGDAWHEPMETDDDYEKNPLFSLTVDLNVLDHLADGLYSSVAAVLTEAVANAWDADAKTVRLDLDIDDDRILLADDGVGMDVDAVNERYLRVGYRRRDDSGETTAELRRPVMGRKGIGKLSLFSIADEIRIETKRRGGGIVALLIDVEELREKMKKPGYEVYHPRPVDPEHAQKLSDRGTVVVLSKLKKFRLRETKPESLRRRLARRFSVVGSEDFRVYVDGVEVTSRDRADLKFVQYAWVFEGTDFSVPDGGEEPKRFDLRAREAGWPPERKISGWIGTVDKPKQLATPEGNLNSVVVLSRGRLVQEDILPKISSAGLFTKYVTGQIEADWLDETGEDDIVTSDRQRLREDDERVAALSAFLTASMNEIGNRWTELRNQDKTDELRSRYPRIDEWLRKLESGWKSKAEKLLGRIAAMEIESDEEERDRKELVRHAIYGFERLRLRGDPEALEEALREGTDALLRVLSARDSLEAALYRDIVSNRLEAVSEFSKLTDDDAREKVLQKYLFDHLWLLDPSWDRPTEDEAMEERLRLLPEFADDEATNERYGRIDIRYRTVSGKAVLVELKRASAKPSSGQLLDQVEKYQKALKAKFHERFEAVIVLGSKPENAETAISSVMPGSKVLTYDELIVRAKQAYSEYLERSRKIDFIDGILDADEP